MARTEIGYAPQASARAYPAASKNLWSRKRDPTQVHCRCALPQQDRSSTASALWSPEPRYRSQAPAAGIPQPAASENAAQPKTEPAGDTSPSRSPHPAKEPTSSRSDNAVHGDARTAQCRATTGSAPLRCDAPARCKPGPAPEVAAAN